MSHGIVDGILVTARKHSRRLPGKNRAKVGGLPLWMRPCILGRRLSIRTIVDTDDEVIFNDSIAHGYETHWRTIPPEDKGGNHWQAIRAACQDCGLRSFMLLQPTSPFRSLDIARQAISKFDGVSAVLTFGDIDHGWDGNIGIFTAEHDKVPDSAVAVINLPGYSLQIDEAHELDTAKSTWHLLPNGGLW